MTAQFTESITYKGRTRQMCTTPLCNYFELAKKKSPFGRNSCTALYRGYIGGWEIVDNRLYLIKVQAGFDFDGGNTIKLEDIFPGYSERVFAHWFSGEVRLPDGELRKYKHMGFGSKYERDILLHMERGVITSEKIIVNGKET